MKSTDTTKLLMIAILLFAVFATQAQNKGEYNRGKGSEFIIAIPVKPFM